MYRIDKDTVEFDGANPGQLPDNFWTKEFILAMLRTPAHQSGSANRMCGLLRPAERNRLAQMCSNDPELSNLWLVASFDWATVGSPTGKWTLDPDSIVYQDDVLTFLVDRVTVLVTGQQFITSPDGVVMTFAEFRIKFGMTVQAHMQQFLAAETRRIERTLTDLGGQVVLRDIDLACRATGEIKTHLLYVLSTVEPSRWPLPAGWSFVQNKEISNAR